MSPSKKGRGRPKGGQSKSKPKPKKKISEKDMTLQGSIGDPDNFEVEKAVDKRTVNGKTEYFLKWRGWPSSTNTYEPLEHLSCPEIIHKFEKSLYLKSMQTNVLEKKAERKMKKERMVTGFDKGLMAKQIIDIIRNKDDNVIYMLIKWKNRDFLEFVPAEICHKKISDMACKFYLSKMEVDKRGTELAPNILKELSKDHDSDSDKAEKSDSDY